MSGEIGFILGCVVSNVLWIAVWFVFWNWVKEQRSDEQ